MLIILSALKKTCSLKRDRTSLSQRDKETISLTFLTKNISRKKKSFSLLRLVWSEDTAKHESLKYKHLSKMATYYFEALTITLAFCVVLLQEYVEHVP